MNAGESESTGIHVGDGARTGDITVHGNVAGRDIITITEDLSYEVGELAQNPYLGLASYTYATRAWFGGREQQVQEAVRLLTAVGSEPVLVLVTGASGSGKSSFVQAGVVPALEDSYRTNGVSTRWSVMRPGRKPIAALSRALHALGIDSVPELRAPEDLQHVLLSNTSATQVSVLVIDQFEELFTQSEPDERDTLCAMLAQMAAFEQVRTHVIATLRADYLPSLFDSAALFESVKRDGIELRAMLADELARAMQRPLQQQARVENKDKRLQPALVERLVEDVNAGGPSVLPLLQVTLARLWDEPPQRMTVDRYRSLTDALERQAEEAFARDRQGHARTPAEQLTLMSILLDLVEVSLDDDAHHDVRRTVPKHELVQGDPERSKFVEEMVEARLLSTWVEQRESTSVELIDIIHETLLTNWARLRSAIHDQRELLQQRARFRLAVQEWERNGRANEYLFRGGRLADALEWQAVPGSVLTPLQQSFVDASRALQESEQRAAERRTRITIGTLVGVVLVIGGLAVFALTQQQEAVAQKNVAVAQSTEAARQQQLALNERDRANTERDTATSRELAASALGLQTVDPELGVLLAARAASPSATVESEIALRQSLVASHLRGVIQLPSMQQAAAIFSPDGSRIITYSGKTDVDPSEFPDKAVPPVTPASAEIWDTVSRQSGGQLPGGPVGGKQSFSPNGRYVLLSSGTTDVQVWDLTSGRASMTLRGQTGAFEPVHGNRIVTASSDGTIRLWNASTGEMQRSLTAPVENGHTYEWVRFSADGSRALAGGSLLSVPLRAWDADTGQEVGPMQAAALSGGLSVFSPDGSHIAHFTGVKDPRIEIWSLDQQQLQTTIATGSQSNVDSLAFSPDGRRLLSSGPDDRVLVSDVATGREIMLEALQRTSSIDDPLHGETTIASFSADGRYVSVFSQNGPGAQVWDATTGKDAGILPSTGRPMFSTVGHDLVTVGGALQFWHPSTSGELLSVCCDVASAVLSSDGGRLATLSSSDRMVQSWNLQTGQPIPVNNGPVPNRIPQARLSPDGSRLAFAANPRTVVVRDLGTGNEVSLAHAADLSALEVPDATHVLTETRDGVLHAWDAATGGELAQLKASGPLILSADGLHLLATTVNMQDVSAMQMWQNATHLQFVHPLSGASALQPADHVSLSADGSRAVLSTGSAQNGRSQVEVWDTATGALLTSKPLDYGDVGSGRAYTSTLNAAGTRLLYFGMTDQMSVWDVDADAMVGPVYPKISGAYLTGDGQRLITTDNSGQHLQVWDVASGTELLKVNVNGPLTFVGANHDETELAAIDSSHQAVVFGCEVMCPLQKLLNDIVPSRTTRQLTPQEEQKYLHTQSS